MFYDAMTARYRQTGRFPTPTLKGLKPEGVMITGYRPFGVLVDAQKQVAPNLALTHPDPDPKSFLEFWGPVTDRKLQEVEPVTS